MPTSSNLIVKYFPELSPKQIKQFDQLQGLYEHWNSKINVISRKDMDQFYLHHVLHSLGIAKVMSFEAESEILDVGTGGGFPGIPLAILFPAAHFHLVDSIGKKITVVAEVAKALQLSNVEVQQARAESLNRTYDFVVSRAVTRMIQFYPWIKGKIKKKDFNSLQNGILYLKGGEIDEEMQETAKPYRAFPLSSFFEEEFFETKKVIYMPWTEKR